MGYEIVKLEATASVSRHNSVRDRLDNVRWDDFCRRVRELAKDEEYKNLHIDIMGAGEE